MEFIDTHSHYCDEAFAQDADEAIAKGVAAGVGIQLQADVDSKERDSMYAIVGRHPGVLFPMVGLYPGSVDVNWRSEIDMMIPYRERGAVAVGEIGLDYHYGAETRNLQIEAFRTQLELAAQWDLPVNIHLREATDDFFMVMDDCKSLGIRGNIHAFSGSYETFMRLQKYGDWRVGIGGVVTFRNAGVAEAVRRIPLERILLETDSPYLTPLPFRGRRNDSSYIPVIATKIAELQGITVEQVAEVTTASARELFSI